MRAILPDPTRLPTRPVSSPASKAATIATLLFASLVVSAAGLAGAPASSRSADPFDAGTRSVRIFHDGEGIPQNTVHSIVLDRRGYLWIGTQDGAAFYDGRGWTTVEMPERSRSNFVRAILAGRDGTMWFGTQAAGLVQLRAGALASVTIGDRQVRRVNALFEAESPGGGRAIWVATHNNGLARLEGERWTFFDRESGLPSNRVWAVLATTDAGGAVTVWAGTEAGLARLSPGADRFEVAEGFPRESVNSLLQTTVNYGSRVLWVGTYGGGLARLAGGRWTRLRSRDGMPSDHVTSLATRSRSEGPTVVWVGTDGGGVARIEGDRIETLGAEAGLPATAVYSLLDTSAEEGVAALWVGTRNGGLARLRDDLWRSFQPARGATTRPVNCLLESAAEDGAAEMWFGTDGGGLACLREGHWTIHDTSSGALRSNSVLCLLETRDGAGERTLWAGTRNGGLSALNRGSWRAFDRASGTLPNDLVQCLLETREEDGSPTVWVGTRAGLAALRGRRWASYDIAAGLPGNSVLALHETRGEGGTATLWVGTDRGIARRRGERFEAIPVNASLPNLIVQCLTSTVTAGRLALWAGTDGGGAAVVFPETLQAEATLLNHASDPRLPNDVVYQIADDGRGHVYLLTNKGVALVSATPGAGRGATRAFTVEDGLPSNQGNRGAAIVDRRGRIWVGTVAGAAALDPARVEADSSPKRLLLDVVVVAGDSVRPLVAGAVLGHAENHLAVEATLLSFFREADTRYRFQLSGLEAEPSSWRADSRAQYPRLPRGSYTLRVWGRDHAGNVSGPIELGFRILPAPWLTWWAYLAYAGVLAAAVWSAVRWRLAHHRRRERDLTLLVDARTRELAEANRLLVELSYLDPLTGIANRRRFDERYDQEWRRAIRGRWSLGLVMIDIDGFKAFNDAYGHVAGDDSLRRVAAALADGLPRAGDSLARYGGEEFAIVLPATDLQGAAKVGEQLRLRVEQLEIADRHSPFGVVTISCGAAAMLPLPELPSEDLVRMADQALYQAKLAGKNCTRAQGAIID